MQEKDRERLEYFVRDIIKESYMFHNSDFSEYDDFKFEVFIESLLLYASRLEEVRHKFNIIGKNENVVTHIIDCLSALPVFIEIATMVLQDKHEGKKDIIIADLGSGAGLPGILLALAFSTMKFSSSWYLVERHLKKSSFLNESVVSLKQFLSYVHVDIFAVNLGEWKPNEKPDIITTRAFQPLKKIADDIKKVNRGAQLLFYKGKKEVIQEEFSPFISDTMIIRETYQLSTDALYPSGERPTGVSPIQRHIVYANWA